MAQPTVSHAIAELEKHYNVELFERINQRLVLTEIGKELFMKGKEILAEFEEFESLAESQGRNPRVRVGSTLTLGQTVIPAFMMKIQDTALNIRPHIVIKPAVAIQRELERGNLDFAILDGEITSPYLIAQPFKEEKLVAVAHPKLMVASPLSLKDFAKHPLLLREKGNLARDYLEKVLHDHNLSAQPTIDSVNNQVLITAASAGLGIAFLPSSVVEEHLADGRLIEIRVKGLDAIRTDYIVIHKNKKQFVYPLTKKALLLLEISIKMLILKS